MRAKKTISRKLKTISQEMRDRFYYSIPVAGAQIGLSRSAAYRAAGNGLIPTERDGKYELVPRQPWDRMVEKLLGSAKASKPRKVEDAAAVDAAA